MSGHLFQTAQRAARVGKIGMSMREVIGVILFCVASGLRAGPVPEPASAQGGGSGAVTAEPLSSPGEWISSDDFPAEALAAGVTGTVDFELTVAASGVPTACRITGESGSSVLDQATCALLMQRARFKPVRSASGLPTAGLYSSRVKWRIPGASEPVDGVWAMSFLVATDGSVSQCRHEKLSGPAEMQARSEPVPCPAYKYRPLKDHNGQPARPIRVRIVTSVEVNRE